MARILVIDDEVHIRQVVSLKLSSAGHEVIQASNGADGQETALVHKPDLIITDYQMPRMNGLEMCRALRQHADIGPIPVILLSGREQFIAPAEMAAVGIVTSLGKPFSPRELLQKVTEVLDSASRARRAG